MPIQNDQKASLFIRLYFSGGSFNEVSGGLQCNMKEAVEMAGLAWQGRAQGGLDDVMVGAPRVQGARGSRASASFRSGEARRGSSGAPFVRLGCAFCASQRLFVVATNICCNFFYMRLRRKPCLAPDPLAPQCALRP